MVSNDREKRKITGYEGKSTRNESDPRTDGANDKTIDRYNPTQETPWDESDGGRRNERGGGEMGINHGGPGW